MTKGGATPEAVKFTQELYDGTKQIGVMEEVKAFPPVSLAWVVYPLRTGDENGLLIVNGKPPFVDPDDVAKLDKTALQKDTNFQMWKRTNPKLDVYPGDRAGGVAQVQFARVWPGSKAGEQKFLFSYPLRDGCATCDRVAFANYFWKFDASGKFTGTELMSVTRGAPPVQRHNPIQPPAAPRGEGGAPAPH
jgi:hypothetical protein